MNCNHFKSSILLLLLLLFSVTVSAQSNRQFVGRVTRSSTLSFCVVAKGYFVGNPALSDVKRE